MAILGTSGAGRTFTMQLIDVYKRQAVVCAAVALLLMNFSKNGKTVDLSLIHI